jgi:hypothetical protein
MTATNAASACIRPRPIGATGCPPTPRAEHRGLRLRPIGATGCPPTPRAEPRAAASDPRGLHLRPGGAQGCSHGWSDAALSVAEPVENVAPSRSFLCVFRPGGAEGSPVSPRVPIDQGLLRPCRGGPPTRVPVHGLRRRSAAFTRGYSPWPLRGPRRGAGWNTARESAGAGKAAVAGGKR